MNFKGEISVGITIAWEAIRSRRKHSQPKLSLIVFIAILFPRINPVASITTNEMTLLIYINLCVYSCQH